MGVQPARLKASYCRVEVPGPRWSHVHDRSRQRPSEKELAKELGFGIRGGFAACLGKSDPLITSNTRVSKPLVFLLTPPAGPSHELSPRITVHEAGALDSLVAR